jgi:hypothetical protein
MTTLIPYRYEFDYDGNLRLEFQWKKTEALGFWETKIRIDPTTKEILESSCDCPNCGINRVENSGYRCKHIDKSEQVFLRTFDKIFCAPKKRAKPKLTKEAVKYAFN